MLGYLILLVLRLVLGAWLDLSHATLKIDLWHGGVQLQNVVARTQTKKWTVGGLTLVSGRLGSVEVLLSWSARTSGVIRFHLHDLDIVVSHPRTRPTSPRAPGAAATARTASPGATDERRSGVKGWLMAAAIARWRHVFDIDIARCQCTFLAADQGTTIKFSLNGWHLGAQEWSNSSSAAESITYLMELKRLQLTAERTDREGELDSADGRHPHVLSLGMEATFAVNNRSKTIAASFKAQEGDLEMAASALAVESINNLLGWLNRPGPKQAYVRTTATSNAFCMPSKTGSRTEALCRDTIWALTRVAQASDIGQAFGSTRAAVRPSLTVRVALEAVRVSCIGEGPPGARLAFAFGVELRSILADLATRVQVPSPHRESSTISLDNKSSSEYMVGHVSCRDIRPFERREDGELLWSAVRRDLANATVGNRSLVTAELRCAANRRTEWSAQAAPIQLYISAEWITIANLVVRSWRPSTSSSSPPAARPPPSAPPLADRSVSGEVQLARVIVCVVETSRSNSMGVSLDMESVRITLQQRQQQQQARMQQTRSLCASISQLAVGTALFSSVSKQEGEAGAAGASSRAGGGPALNGLDGRTPCLTPGFTKERHFEDIAVVYGVVVKDDADDEVAETDTGGRRGGLPESADVLSVDEWLAPSTRKSAPHRVSATVNAVRSSASLDRWMLLAFYGPHIKQAVFTGRPRDPSMSSPSPSQHLLSAPLKALPASDITAATLGRILVAVSVHIKEIDVRLRIPPREICDQALAPSKETWRLGHKDVPGWKLWCCRPRKEHRPTEPACGLQQTHLIGVLESKNQEPSDAPGHRDANEAAAPGADDDDVLRLRVTNMLLTHDRAAHFTNSTCVRWQECWADAAGWIHEPSPLAASDEIDSRTESRRAGALTARTTAASSKENEPQKAGGCPSTARQVIFSLPGRPVHTSAAEDDECSEWCLRLAHHPSFLVAQPRVVASKDAASSAVVHLSTTIGLALDNVLVRIDTSLMVWLWSAIACVKAAAVMGTRKDGEGILATSRFAIPPATALGDRAVTGTERRHPVNSATALPTVQMAVEVGTVQVHVRYRCVPVARISCHSLTADIAKYNPASGLPVRVLGSTAGLELLDDSDVHTRFPGVISACRGGVRDNAVQWDFQGGTNTEPSGTLNVSLKRLCVLYVHRVLMTLIEYPRDSIVPQIKSFGRMPPETALQGSPLQAVCSQRGKRWATVFLPRWTDRPSPGSETRHHSQAMRLRLLVLDSEVHLVQSSYATDALAIMFPRLALWKMDRGWSKQFAMGTFLMREDAGSAMVQDCRRLQRTTRRMSALGTAQASPPRGAADTTMGGERGVRRSGPRAAGRARSGQRATSQPPFAARATRHRANAASNSNVGAEDEGEDREATFFDSHTDAIDELRVLRELLHECENDIARLRKRAFVDMAKAMASAGSDAIEEKGEEEAKQTETRFRWEESAVRVESMEAEMRGIARDIERLKEQMHRENERQQALDAETAVNDAMTGEVTGGLDTRAMPPARLDLLLSDAILCSWCNRNALSTSPLTIETYIGIVPDKSTPCGDSMYPGVPAQLGLMAPGPEQKKLVLVDVLLRHARLRVTQAQYALIVDMIMENFREGPRNIPRNPSGPGGPELLLTNELRQAQFEQAAAEAKEAFRKAMGERPHLSPLSACPPQALFQTLRVFVNVPVRLVDAQLTAAADDPSYYDLLGWLEEHERARVGLRIATDLALCNSAADLPVCCAGPMGTLDLMGAIEEEPPLLASRWALMEASGVKGYHHLLDWRRTADNLRQSRIRYAAWKRLSLRCSEDAPCGFNPRWSAPSYSVPAWSNHMRLWKRVHSSDQDDLLLARLLHRKHVVSPQKRSYFNRTNKMHADAHEHRASLSRVESTRVHDESLDKIDEVDLGGSEDASDEDTDARFGMFHRGAGSKSDDTHDDDDDDRDSDYSDTDDDTNDDTDDDDFMFGAAFMNDEFALLEINIRNLFFAVVKMHDNQGVEIKVHAARLLAVDPQLRQTLPGLMRASYASARGSGVQRGSGSSGIAYGGSAAGQAVCQVIAPTQCPDTEPGWLEKDAQLVYKQNNVQNYRRCFVDILNSVVVANGECIWFAIRFFCEPIWCRGMRDDTVRTLWGMPPTEYFKNLDLEVRLTGSELVLPERFPASPMTDCALSISLDLQYSHVWRGYGGEGPGEVTLRAAASIHRISISPLTAIQVWTQVPVVRANSIQEEVSLSEPCSVWFMMKDMIVPAHRHREARDGSLKDCILFSSTVSQSPGEEDMPHKLRRIEANVAHWADLPTVISRCYRGCGADGDAGDGDGDGEGGDDGANDADNATGAAESKEQGTRPRPSRSGTIEKTQCVRFILSAADVQLVGRAVAALSACLGAAIRCTSDAGPMEVMEASTRAQYHLVDGGCFATSTRFLRGRPIELSMELRTQVADLAVQVVSNTLDVPVLALNTSKLHFALTRIGSDCVQMTAGVQAQALAFNTGLFCWEPLLETMTVDAIVASDKRPASQLHGVDVWVSPVNVNLSQDVVPQLRHALTNPDFVTTIAQASPPYTLTNETGIPVTLAFLHGGEKIATWFIGSGESVHLDFARVARHRWRVTWTSLPESTLPGTTDKQHRTRTAQPDKARQARPVTAGTGSAEFASTADSVAQILGMSQANRHAIVAQVLRGAVEGSDSQSTSGHNAAAGYAAGDGQNTDRFVSSDICFVDKPGLSYLELRKCDEDIRTSACDQRRVQCADGAAPLHSAPTPCETGSVQTPNAESKSLPERNRPAILVRVERKSNGTRQVTLHGCVAVRNDCACPLRVGWYTKPPTVANAAPQNHGFSSRPRPHARWSRDEDEAFHSTQTTVPQQSVSSILHKRRPVVIRPGYTFFLPVPLAQRRGTQLLVRPTDSSYVEWCDSAGDVTRWTRDAMPSIAISAKWSRVQQQDGISSLSAAPDGDDFADRVTFPGTRRASQSVWCVRVQVNQRLLEHMRSAPPRVEDLQDIAVAGDGFQRPSVLGSSQARGIGNESQRARSGNNEASGAATRASVIESLFAQHRQPGWQGKAATRADEKTRIRASANRGPIAASAVAPQKPQRSPRPSSDESGGSGPQQENRRGNLVRHLTSRLLGHLGGGAEVAQEQSRFMVELVIRPPLVLTNTLCRSVLYQVANSSQEVYAEGVLLPQQRLSLHSVSLTEDLTARFSLDPGVWSGWAPVFWSTDSPSTDMRTSGTDIQHPDSSPSTGVSQSPVSGAWARVKRKDRAVGKLRVVDIPPAHASTHSHPVSPSQLQQQHHHHHQQQQQQRDPAKTSNLSGLGPTQLKLRVRHANELELFAPVWVVNRSGFSLIVQDRSQAKRFALSRGSSSSSASSSSNLASLVHVLASAASPSALLQDLLGESSGEDPTGAPAAPATATESVSSAESPALANGRGSERIRSLEKPAPSRESSASSLSAGSPLHDVKRGSSESTLSTLGAAATGNIRKREQFRGRTHLCTLTVALPFNHFDTVEVHASSQSTVNDILRTICSQFLMRAISPTPMPRGGRISLEALTLQQFELIECGGTELPNAVTSLDFVVGDNPNPLARDATVGTFSTWTLRVCHALELSAQRARESQSTVCLGRGGLRLRSALSEWSAVLDVAKFELLDSAVVHAVTLPVSSDSVSIARGQQHDMGRDKSHIENTGPGPGEDGTHEEKRDAVATPAQSELGLTIEQGKGLLADTTVLTLLPRFVLFNRSAFALQVRQVPERESDVPGSTYQAASSAGGRGHGASDDAPCSTAVGATARRVARVSADCASEHQTLEPGGHSPFQWPSATAPRLACIRFVSTQDRAAPSLEATRAATTTVTGASSAANTESAQTAAGTGEDDAAAAVSATFRHSDPNRMWEWSTGFSFSQLGEVPIKIRHVMSASVIRVVNASVRLIGASYVVQFADQDAEYPLYRIDNKTSFRVRFKQRTRQGTSAAAAAAAAAALRSVGGATKESDNMGAGGVSSTTPGLLEPNASCTYAWDYPQQPKKTLKVEFSNRDEWIARDCSLDDLSMERYLRIPRDLSHLSTGTALFSGPLERRITDLSAEGPLQLGAEPAARWETQHAIVKAGTMFLFSDSTCESLSGIISLAQEAARDPVLVEQVLRSDDPASTGAVSKLQQLLNETRSVARIFKDTRGPGNNSNSGNRGSRVQSRTIETCTEIKSVDLTADSRSSIDCGRNPTTLLSATAGDALPGMYKTEAYLTHYLRRENLLHDPSWIPRMSLPDSKAPGSPKATLTDVSINGSGWVDMILFSGLVAERSQATKLAQRLLSAGVLGLDMAHSQDLVSASIRSDTRSGCGDVADMLSSSQQQQHPNEEEEEQQQQHTQKAKMMRSGVFLEHSVGARSRDRAGASATLPPAAPVLHGGLSLQETAETGVWQRRRQSVLHKPSMRRASFIQRSESAISGTAAAGTIVGSPHRLMRQQSQSQIYARARSYSRQQRARSRSRTESMEAEDAGRDQCGGDRGDRVLDSEPTSEGSIVRPMPRRHTTRRASRQFSRRVSRRMSRRMTRSMSSMSIREDGPAIDMEECAVRFADSDLVSYQWAWSGQQHDLHRLGSLVQEDETLRFRISLPTRTHEFRCESMATLERWVSALRVAVDVQDESSTRDAQTTAITLHTDPAATLEAARLTTLVEQQSTPLRARTATHEGNSNAARAAVLQQMQALQQASELRNADSDSYGKRGWLRKPAMVEVRMRVRSDGPTKVLELTEVGTEHGVSPSRSDESEDIDLSLGATRRLRRDREESVEQTDSAEHMEVMVRVEAVGISICDIPVYHHLGALAAAPTLWRQTHQAGTQQGIARQSIEIAYFAARGLQLGFTSNGRMRRIRTLLNTLQMDNSLRNALIPVTLKKRYVDLGRLGGEGDDVAQGTFSVRSGSADGDGVVAADGSGRHAIPDAAASSDDTLRAVLESHGSIPALHFNATQYVARDPTLRFYESCRLWVAPMDLNMEEEFLVRIVRFARRAASTVTDNNTRRVHAEDDNSGNMSSSSSSSRSSSSSAAATAPASAGVSASPSSGAATSSFGGASASSYSSAANDARGQGSSDGARRSKSSGRGSASLGSGDGGGHLVVEDGDGPIGSASSTDTQDLDAVRTATRLWKEGRPRTGSVGTTTMCQAVSAAQQSVCCVPQDQSGSRGRPSSGSKLSPGAEWAVRLVDVDRELSRDEDANGQQCRSMTAVELFMAPTLMGKPMREYRGGFEEFVLQPVMETRVYISSLLLHPLDLRVHYFPTPGSQLSSLSFDENAVVAVVSKLDSTRLRLAALELDNAFGSPRMVSKRVVRHYIVSILKQLPQLSMGSIELIAMPMELLTQLGTGMRGLVYEPLEALRRDGSLLDGVGRGVDSFISGTVGGTFSAASKLTGAVGSGFASLLAFDNSYQRARVRDRLEHVSNIQEGVSQGVRQLGRGLFEGVTGIVAEPVRGWKEERKLVGVGMGFVKGIVGVAVKPTVGVLDLATRTAEGVSNKARSGQDALDDQHAKLLLADASLRLRPPRTFGRHGEMVVYDITRAIGQFLLDSVMADIEPKLDLFATAQSPSISSPPGPLPFHDDSALPSTSASTQHVSATTAAAAPAGSATAARHHKAPRKRRPAAVMSASALLQEVTAGDSTSQRLTVSAADELPATTTATVSDRRGRSSERSRTPSPRPRDERRGQSRERSLSRGHESSPDAGDFSAAQWGAKAETGVIADMPSSLAPALTVVGGAEIPRHRQLLAAHQIRATRPQTGATEGESDSAEWLILSVSHLFVIRCAVYNTGESPCFHAPQLVFVSPLAAVADIYEEKPARVLSSDPAVAATAGTSRKAPPTVRKSQTTRRQGLSTATAQSIQDANLQGARSMVSSASVEQAATLYITLKRPVDTSSSAVWAFSAVPAPAAVSSGTEERPRRPATAVAIVLDTMGRDRIAFQRLLGHTMGAPECWAPRLPPRPNDIRLQGWVYKRHHGRLAGLRKDMRKYYFVLANGVLYEYSRVKDAELDHTDDDGTMREQELNNKTVRFWDTRQYLVTYIFPLAGVTLTQSGGGGSAGSSEGARIRIAHPDSEPMAVVKRNLREKVLRDKTKEELVLEFPSSSQHTSTHHLWLAALRDEIEKSFRRRLAQKREDPRGERTPRAMERRPDGTLVLETDGRASAKERAQFVGTVRACLRSDN